MTAARPRRADLVALTDSLGQRDLEIVQTLRNVRVATTIQLQRLHFYQGTPLSNARSCRRVLERLSRLGVLVRLERRIGGVRAGSAGFVHALGVAGQRLTQTQGRRRRPWTPGRDFLNHALAVTELYTVLSEVSRSDRIELQRFDTEPRCWRKFSGPAGETVVVKPDAFVRIATKDFIEHVFVEVDLGTESSTALTTKMARYREYWASGREQLQHGVFPRVVWLVPDRRRYAELVRVAGQQPAGALQLFKVAEFPDAVTALRGGDA